MEVAQLVGIILLVAVVGLLLVFVVKNVAAPKKVEGVQRYLKQGKTQAAIKLAKAILQKDPKDYLAHYYLGKAYLADNKNELALMELKYVDQNGIFDNRLPEQTFRKAIAALYSKFNQQEDALKQYLLLTKLEPTVADNYFQVA
ncbi:MAG: tetratricopeptide repeat protein, partial [Treponema sp.]|nr:tetratricopeptide repeat protein [Treponema sp.]